MGWGLSCPVLFLTGCSNKGVLLPNFPLIVFINMVCTISNLLNPSAVIEKLKVKFPIFCYTMSYATCI